MTWLGARLDLPAPEGLAALVQQAQAAGIEDLIAFPGLVNSHDHLEFNCYPPTGTPPYRDFLEWSCDVQADHELTGKTERIPFKTRRQLGLLKNLLWGVTAVADHGGKTQDGVITIIPQPGAIHSPELASRPRLQLIFGRDAAVMHLAEGTTEASRMRAIALLHWNLRGRRVAGIHAVSFKAKDFAALDALIWCPGSNHFLFGRSADVATAAKHTKILFGTDSTLSTPGTLWDQLRAARGAIPDQALLASLTTTPAAFWGLHGRSADYVLARRRFRDDWDAFFGLTPEDILVVIHHGRIVLLDAALTAGIAAPDEYSAITLGKSRKFLRMPLPDLWLEFGQAAPTFDIASLVGRFVGLSVGASRAA